MAQTGPRDLTEKPASNPDPPRSDLSTWQPAGRHAVRWREWSGDFVVFNPLSGQTHLLDISAGEILKHVIEESPRTREIRSRIAEFLEVEDNDQLTETVCEILARLAELGLIKSTA